MKRVLICGLALLMMIAATSCIFEAPGDKFYRTLWKSEQTPLSPLNLQEFTLDFLCGQKVCIKTGTGTITSHGNYETCGQTAIFQNLIMDADGQTITFIKAERDKDTLILYWETDDSTEPSTTTLHRLGSYE